MFYGVGPIAEAFACAAIQKEFVMDKSRNDFEAWASQESFDVYRNGDADYFNKVTQFAWEGWQASRKQALEEAANECDSYGAQLSNECAAAIRSLEGNAKETT